MAVQNKSNVPIGTVLEGKFRITREIGRGGMAAVYEAENIDIGKRVAVKVLAAELITSRVVRERFIREARAASAVRSPHICDVYDSGMFEERPFLVMELLEGESLYDMLTRLRRLDMPTTLSVITQTARGLGKAHEANIVHRDLKPENIFVSRDEDSGLIVKLLDFGLAKFYEPTNDGDPKTVRLTREGALFGTPAYMSPEQAKGQGEVDHRSDLWALGCIVYECLTGQTVWSVEQGVAMILAQVASAPVPRLSRLRPDLPLQVDAWLARALDRDVARRFQTAREFADTLAEAFSGDGAAPSAASVRQQSFHSEAEAVQVDELMAGPDLGPPELEGDASADGVTPEPVLKPARAGSSGVWALLAAAAVVLGGYGAWLHWLHPAGERNALRTTPRAAPTASGRQKAAAKVVVDPDAEPFADLVREAQGVFAKDPKGALEKLKGAYALGSAAPVRALLAHATTAVDEATPRGCKVTAVARPRPYQLEQAASSPTLARTSEGVLLGWVDSHADARRRQGYVVLLDDALRRKGEPLAVTPEASSVADLGMLAVGDKVVVAFHDDGGKQPGVYVRQLGTDGRIASAARRISRGRPSDGSLSLTPSGDGGYLAVWAEELVAGVTDLVLVRVGPTLEPKGELQRLSAFPVIKGVQERVSMPDAAVAHGALNVAFTLGLPAQHALVSLLSVPLSELEKGKGVETMVRPGKRGAQAGADPVLGTLRVVAKTVGRSPQPRLACEKEGCLVGWDEEKGGAKVAFLEHGKPQPLWHRDFAEKGARPAIVGDDAGLATAWYEESRLRLAPIGRDGVGMPSIVNRVSGLQPHPALARGSKPGEWLLAWRDYEAAHFELFALKAECP